MTASGTGRDARRFPPSFLALLIITSSAALALAQNPLSPPVGFIRVEVSSNSQVLASSPFHALGEAGATPEVGVLGWDGARGGYTNLTGAPPVAGQGFWLVNAAATQTVVFLAGEVPLDTETAVPLAPGLNLIGHPFPSTVGVDATGLDPAALTTADGTPVATLRPGEGYWYGHDGPVPVFWLETRPYANPFPTNDLPPRILALTVESGVVRLQVIGEGPLDLYYQDLTPQQSFEPLSGWRLVGTLGGSGERAWQDAGDPERPPPDTVFGRVYLLATGPLESALATAGNLAPTRASSPDAMLEEPGDATAAALGPAAADVLIEVAVGPANSPPLVRPLPLERVIFVDARRGDNRYDGRAGVVTATGVGPKRTMAAGLAAANAGDTLVVLPGVYEEDLAAAGRGLDVRLEAGVTIGRAALATPEAP